MIQPLHPGDATNSRLIKVQARNLSRGGLTLHTEHG